MARGVGDANFHGKSELPNGRDQLEHIDDPTNDLQVDYAYDANGNREQRIVRQNNIVTSQVDYTFDARDRLIQAQPNAPNEAIVEYQYDADDRRIARIETPRINGTPQPPITTLYVFDNSTLLHEANLAGITDTYRRSAKLDRHIAHATNTVRHYQLDALDTPVAMTDATGATVNATTFDAWGNPTQQTAAGTTTVPWQVPNYNPLISGQAALLNNDNQSIGFTGYQKDSATGLYYAGARFYDPLIGGFNGMDPAAGDPLVPLSYNAYLYAYASPTGYTDTSGRCSLEGSHRCGMEAMLWNAPNDGAREIAKASLARYDAQMAGRASAPVTGIVRSVIGGARALAQLAGDAAYVIPESILPERANLGSRVRYVQALVGIGKTVAHPIDTVRGHYRSGLDVAQQYWDAGNEFEAKAAEWQAHTDVAQMAFGAQQLARTGVRAGVSYAGSRILPNYEGPNYLSMGDDFAASADHVPTVAPETSTAARTVQVTESLAGPETSIATMADPMPGKTYITYEFINANGEVVYVGRASGAGTSRLGLPATRKTQRPACTTPARGSMTR